MYQTVIFDLDGTLLNTIADLAAAGNHVCRAYGWPEHTEEAYKAMVGHGMANLIARFSPPQAQDEAQRAETLRRFNAYYGPHCADLTRPYPGMVDLVGRLRQEGVQMAVYSNKADDFSQQLINRFFPGQFALVQGKLPDVPVKPDPAGIRTILRKLGAAAERTLFVGDSSVDVRTGRNAGTAVCAVSWGFRSRASLVEAGADRIADTAEELEAAIREETLDIRALPEAPDRKV